MHNYDYYYTLCLLLQVTCSLVNPQTRLLIELVNLFTCKKLCELPRPHGHSVDLSAV